MTKNLLGPALLLLAGAPAQAEVLDAAPRTVVIDRKSTRLNSSHVD